MDDRAELEWQCQGAGILAAAADMDELQEGVGCEYIGWTNPHTKAMLKYTPAKRIRRSAPLPDTEAR